MSVRWRATVCALAALATIGLPALAPLSSAAQERARRQAQERPEGTPIDERTVATIPEPGTCFLPGTTSFDDAIATHVRAQLRSIVRCRERCVRCPPHEGRLVVAIEVADRGHAERVWIVEQTLADGALASCITSTIARLPMPRPPRGIARGAVRVPFVFVARPGA